ncbi:MAG: hypothetical protein U0326_00235 [Polyangiales bacterium]
MNVRTIAWVGMAVASLGCASTVDGTWGSARDAGRDVPPGVNPTGVDPFRPVDAGPILVDGSTDTGTWQLPDASVFDQRYAYLYVGSYLNTGLEGAYASAEFRLFPRPEDTRCEYVSAGNWDMLTCDEEAEAPRDTHPEPFPQAGPITVRGGTEPVSLNPNRNGQYAYFYEPRPVFHGPARIEIRAVGTASVPAFSVMVDVPSPLTLTSPVITRGVPVPISTTQDLTISWVPSDARSIYVNISAIGRVSGRRHSVRALAEFPGAAGRGTIPARALRAFTTLSALESQNFSVSPQNLSTQRIGAWPVQVTTSGLGVSVDASIR